MKVVLEHNEIIRAIGQRALAQLNMGDGKFSVRVDFIATEKSPAELTAIVEVTPKAGGGDGGGDG